MKYLIVTADDIGLTKSINEGIVRAARDGIVTSVNIMPAGPAFDDALLVMKRMGFSEAGAHLSLTEVPLLSEPAKIPTLAVASGGTYMSRNQLFLDLFRRKVDPDELYGELRTQLQRVVNSGLKVTNLSSHEHIHMLPAVLKMFIRLSEEFNIKSIRFPCNEQLAGPINIKKLYRKSILLCFSKGTEGALAGSNKTYTDNFLGFLNSGNLDEDELLGMISNLREGATELVCHPGFLGPEILDMYRFHINCEKELFALTSPRVKKLISKCGVKLISYQEFLKIKAA